MDLPPDFEVDGIAYSPTSAWSKRSVVLQPILQLKDDRCRSCATPSMICCAGYPGISASDLRRDR